MSVTSLNQLFSLGLNRLVQDGADAELHATSSCCGDTQLNIRCEMGEGLRLQHLVEDTAHREVVYV